MYTPAHQDGDRSWVFGRSTTNVPALKALCQSVDAHFQLPKARLCRYFAESDDQYLIDRNGAHFRGFHAPYAVRPILPTYLVECFFHPFDYFRDVKFEDTIAFDNLIYIRRTTYADTTGLALTYAHELQHVTQHANTPRLLYVNQVFYQELKQLEPATIATDIPHEREANIVSKRVAEVVLGTEAVKVFAEEQVRLMHGAGEHEQEARWIFFRDVPSATKFDLLEATVTLVEKYKNVLKFDEVDVNQPEWWVGSLKKSKAMQGVASR